MSDEKTNPGKYQTAQGGSSQQTLEGPRTLKAPRSLDEIQAEYANVCREIGHNEYLLKSGIPRTLDVLYDRALHLNREADEAAKATKETPSDG